MGASSPTSAAAPGRASEGCEHQSAFDVFVSPSSGGPRRRITKKSGDPQCLAWSSQGRLGFEATDGTTAVVQRDGSLRTFHPGGCPVWSPAGDRYVVTTATGVGFLNADGTGRRTVRLPIKAAFSDPVWSPDGRSLAVEVEVYRGSIDTHEDLYTLKADGTGFRGVPLPS